MKEQLINDVLQFLTGKLPAEYATELRLYLYYLLAGYDITKKCTDVAVWDEKNYMDYLYMYLASLKWRAGATRPLSITSSSRG